MYSAIPTLGLTFSAPVLRVQPPDVVAFSLGEQFDQEANDRAGRLVPLDPTSARSVRPSGSKLPLECTLLQPSLHQAIFVSLEGLLLKTDSLGTFFIPDHNVHLLQGTNTAATGPASSFNGLFQWHIYAVGCFVLRQSTDSVARSVRDAFQPLTIELRDRGLGCGKRDTDSCP